MAHQRPKNCFLYTSRKKNIQKHPALHILVKYQTVHVNKTNKEDSAIWVFQSFWYKATLKITKKFFATANTRKNDGQTEVQSFLLSRSLKSLTELLENTWKIGDATAMLQRENRLCTE